MYQYSGGDNWFEIGDAKSKLYGGSFGLVGTDSAGDLYRYTGTPNEWERIGGPAAQFVVTGGGVYGLNPDRTAVYEYTGSGTAWTKVGGPARQLYGGGWGLLGIDPAGDVYRYRGTPEEWTRIGGPGAQFVYGFDIYGLTPHKDAVYQNYDTDDWFKIGALADRLISSGFSRRLLATNPTGVYRYDRSPGEWTQLGGPGAQFVVGDDGIYGLRPGKDAVDRWTGHGTTWTQIGGPAHSITVYAD
ncbi:hypothetical protein IU459_23250 [Nocardia amamiensis]|uniref:Tachylectin 2 domain-containing protein n=1 Tax=Nocardia amamiensis TaxID=404578 RepID=A0ABS0CV08_9NOCA|nr:tectonin domain-containing protein [Nocardia amamiensis]MBF6300439.1 hypothetical protein [Nocardia amamiensis]